MTGLVVLLIGGFIVVAVINILFPRDAPPPNLYDSYGMPVPLGRSRFFDVEYRPYEEAKRIVFGLIFAISLLFAMYVYHDEFKENVANNPSQLYDELFSESPIYSEF